MATKNTRGEQRFASITYSQLARWTGLTVHTVRSYSRRGQFVRDDIDSVLAWVNARRQKLGWPLIGQPEDTAPPPIVPIAAQPPDSGYDPRTASY